MPRMWMPPSWVDEVLSIAFCLGSRIAWKSIRIGTSALNTPASQARFWSRSSDIRKFQGNRRKRQGGTAAKPPPFRSKVERSDCPATHLGGLPCRASRFLTSPTRTQPRRTLIQRRATRPSQLRRRGRSRSGCPHRPQAIFRRRASLLAFRPPCHRKFRQARRCHSRKRDRWLRHPLVRTRVVENWLRARRSDPS